MPFLAVFQEPTVRAASSGDDWPMFQHDPAHTGYSTSVLPSNPTYLWSYPTNVNYISDAVVSNGYVYFTTLLDSVVVAAMVFAVNASTGELIWSSPGNAFSYLPFVPIPAVADGYVYTSTDAYNASTGQLMFNYTSYQATTSPTVTGGILYLGYYSSESLPGIIALNAQNGASIWNFSIPALTSNYFPIDEQLAFPPPVANGVVYFSEDGIYALNAQTGAQLWHNDTDVGTGWGSIAVANGQVYDCNDELYCLDAVTGNELWVYPAGAIDICPAIANGIVYAGSYALKASTGQLVWNNTLTQLSSPSIAAGSVYYAHYTYTDQGGDFNLSHEIYGFNASTGQMIWNYTLPGLYASYFTQPPAISNSDLYITQIGGQYEGLYAFGAKIPSPTESPSLPEFQPIVALTVLISLTFIALVLALRKKTSTVLGFAIDRSL